MFITRDDCWKPSVTAGLVYTQTYRVTGSTTVKELRADACRYWKVSTDEFVLKTVGYNAKVQESMLVSHCFRPGELTQLVLVKKNPKNIFVSELEKRACFAKKGRAAMAASSSESEKTDNLSQMVFKKEKPFLEQLNAFPGLRELLLQKDIAVAHEPEKLRECVGWLVLLVLSLLLVVLRREWRTEYYLAHDVRTRIVDRLGFHGGAIKTGDDYYAFLAKLESELTHGDLFNHFSSPLGYLRLRQQRVLDGVRAGETETAQVCVLKRDQQVRTGNCPARLVAEDSSDSNNEIHAAWSAYVNVLGPNSPVGSEVTNDWLANGLAYFNETAAAVGGLGNFVTRADYDRFQQSDDAEYLRDVLFKEPAFLPLSTVNEIDLNPAARTQWEGRGLAAQIDSGSAEDGDAAAARASRRARRGLQASAPGISPRTFRPPVFADYLLPKRKSNPFHYLSHEQAVASAADVDYESASGLIQNYDASGYRVDWHVDFLHQTMRQDVLQLRTNHWIDIFTRLLILHFVLYNPSTDFFVSCELKVELPATGSAQVSHEILPIRPAVNETPFETETLWPLELSRLVLLLLFVCCYLMPRQVRPTGPSDYRDLQERVKGYAFSWLGALDVGCVVTLLAVFILRYVNFGGTTVDMGAVTGAAESGDASSATATNTETVVERVLRGVWVHLPGSARRDLFAVDGILCALVLFRFASYLTMARHGWIAVTAAKKSVSFLAPWLLFLFLPLLTLLVVMFHVVYGSQAAEYRSYGTAFSTLLRLWRGRLSQQLVTFMCLAVILRLYGFYFTVLGGFSYPEMLDFGSSAAAQPGSYQWGLARWLDWIFPGPVAAPLKNLFGVGERKDTGGMEEVAVGNTPKSEGVGGPGGDAAEKGDFEKDSDERSAVSGEIVILEPPATVVDEVPPAAEVPPDPSDGEGLPCNCVPKEGKDGSICSRNVGVKMCNSDPNCRVACESPFPKLPRALSRTPPETSPKPPASPLPDPARTLSRAPGSWAPGPLARGLPGGLLGFQAPLSPSKKEPKQYGRGFYEVVSPSGVRLLKPNWFPDNSVIPPKEQMLADDYKLVEGDVFEAKMESVRKKGEDVQRYLRMQKPVQAWVPVFESMGGAPLLKKTTEEQMKELPVNFRPVENDLVEAKTLYFDKLRKSAAGEGQKGKKTAASETTPAEPETAKPPAAKPAAGEKKGEISDLIKDAKELREEQKEGKKPALQAIDAPSSTLTKVQTPIPRITDPECAVANCAEGFSCVRGFCEKLPDREHSVCVVDECWFARGEYLRGKAEAAVLVGGGAKGKAAAATKPEGSAAKPTPVDSAEAASPSPKPKPAGALLPAKKLPETQSAKRARADARDRCGAIFEKGECTTEKTKGMCKWKNTDAPAWFRVEKHEPVDPEFDCWGYPVAPA
eukprot:g235.t1